MDTIILQDPCASSEGLPIHLWRHILKHLETSARLTARLVCKAFASLGPHDKIVVTITGSQSHNLSRMHFAAMLLTASVQGPMVEVKQLCGSEDDFIERNDRASNSRDLADFGARSEVASWSSSLTFWSPSTGQQAHPSEAAAAGAGAATESQPALLPMTDQQQQI
ncbi:hypothetical protein WJX74_002969 [Apatococcus lobatus]|uniref:F-box domain-containing protein n=1 Tax=Apatococcus lobatus TaxID=904363 RepID=A0AAW1QD49_9CHLO